MTRFADVRRVVETGSTNADVAALARAGAPEGVVLVADHQTAGRGRRDRRWEAPPGASLLVSVLTRPAAGVARHLVPTALGVAAAEAVRAATGADVRLKWPNDLVVETPGGTRKLSGILAEAVGDAVVVGIGINVDWPPPAELGELAGVAIACNHLTGAPVGRDRLLDALLAGFGAWYGSLPGGEAALRGRYRELSATIGHRVRVETGTGVVEGDALDIDDEGRLLVVDECPDRPVALAVGDVVHLHAR